MSADLVSGVVTPQTPPNSGLSFPRVIRRFRAMTLDSILLLVVVGISVITVSSLGFDSRVSKILSILVPVLVLEPAMVAIFGCTIGHYVTGLKVTQLDGVRRIGFGAALVRFVLKTLLGAWSLVSMLTTQKRQAVHDVLTKSLVLNRSPDTLPEGERLGERIESAALTIGVSKKRRILVGGAYVFGLSVLVTVVAMLTISDACALYQRCTPTEKAVDLAIGFAWLIGTLLVIVGAWRGMLPGARLKRDD